jgi:amidase/6-aminohexanoate-cyclic-dimer hydrolase
MSQPTADIAALYQETDAVGLAAHVAAGDVTPAELLDAALARVAATNPVLNYMAQDCTDRARLQASAPLPRSPLAGVPFLVKDLGVDIAGVRSGSGSRFLEHLAAADSHFIQRADAAGLVTFGKTTTPELGLTVTTESRATGRTRNPWDPERTTGGSSGGAACAVAVGAVPLAQASDGGGSVRVPASCCGLLGLKTSRGRVPLGSALPARGKVEDWNGLSGIGPISRSVRDAAAFLDIFGHPAAGDRVRPFLPKGGYLEAIRHKPPRLNIGLQIAPYSGDRVDPDVHGALHDAALLLGHLGHHVHEARPDIDWAALMEANTTNIATCTARTLDAHAALSGHSWTEEGIEPITAMWHHIAQGRTSRDLQAAISTFEATAISVDLFFEAHDLLLSPVLATPPVALGVLHLDQPSSDFGPAFSAFCPYAVLANISGCPAVSLPLGMSHDGLPIGIMAMAPFGREDLLLQLAAELEAAAPWGSRRPPV